MKIVACLLLFLLATAGYSDTPYNADSKPLAGGKASIWIADIKGKGTAGVVVFIDRNAAPVKYSEVKVRATDKLGNLISVVPSSREKEDFSLLAAKVRVCIGFYTVPIIKESIDKITVEAKGETIEFPIP